MSKIYQARVKIVSRSNGVEMMDLEVGDFLEKFVGGLDEDNQRWYETVVYGATEDAQTEDDIDFSNIKPKDYYSKKDHPDTKPEREELVQELLDAIDADPPAMGEDWKQEVLKAREALR